MFKRNGALSRIARRVTGRVANRPNPSPAVSLTEVDRSIANTGEGLRRTIGRLGMRQRTRLAAKGGKIKSASNLRSLIGKIKKDPQKFLEARRRLSEDGAKGPPKKKTQYEMEYERAKQGAMEEGFDEAEAEEYARNAVSHIKPGFKEGGKVQGLSAVSKLAKKIQEALDSGDTALAKRLKRELSLRGREIPDLESSADKKAREDKLATFAKGGKVAAAKAVKQKLSKSLAKQLKRQLVELESKMAYGKIDPKTGRVEGETKEQAEAAAEFDRLSDEIDEKYGVTLIDDQ